MSNDIRQLVSQLARLGSQAMLLTVTELERPYASAVKVNWVGGQLTAIMAADAPAMAHLLERPFVTLLWPPAEDGGTYIQLECLGDVLGEQILLTPLQAHRQPDAEVLFRAA